MPHLLALDQGTTNTKAVLVDATGTPTARGASPVALSHPGPGRVEQDAEEIWQSVLLAVRRCLDAAPSAPRIEGIALSTQRESVVAWDRGTGRPLSPVLGWQDVRTADWCRSLGGTREHEMVRERTGLRIDPMFSAPKIAWLLEHAVPRRQWSRTCVGTVDSWLLWRLTGGGQHATEAGNASRTLLYDLRELDWAAELLELFAVPADVLPRVVGSSAADLGRCRGVPGLADGTPVLAVLADSHAALLGQGCTEPGSGKATFGTGTSVMTPTAQPGTGAAVATTLAWLGEEPTYAWEGNILASGAALAWTARLLGRTVTELLELAASVDSSEGVALVPALTGLGAPHWDREVRGVLTRLDAGTGAAQVARAAVDAVAHQVCDVVEAMDEVAAAPLQRLRADGGMTASELVMQTQADLLGRPVEVSEVAELSALGSATLGWARLGVPVPARAPGRTVLPRCDPGVRRERRDRWRADVTWLRSGSGQGG